MKNSILIAAFFLFGVLNSNARSLISTFGGNGFKSVYYSKLSAILLEELNERQSEIDKLKNDFRKKFEFQEKVIIELTRVVSFPD